MQVDGVSFGDVGGLDRYIRALKEMVFLPLARYHISTCAIGPSTAQ